MRKSILLTGIFICISLFFSCDALKGVGDKVSPDKLAEGILKKPEPITTSLADASKEKVLPDDFGDNMKPKPLQDLPRTAGGGFLLSPGLYEMTCKSYCLHAGTAGPGKTKGDGYLYAPLKGDKAPIITAIIDNAEAKGAWQQDVQSLIWAVLSKASFNDMSPSLKTVASQLLSKDQIAELNKNAIGILSKDMMAKIQAKLPPAAKKAMELENKMREKFAEQQTNYKELEKMAVLSDPKSSPATEYKRGRWSQHTDGYYIRYFPDTYRQVRMQIYVPPAGKPLAKPGSLKAGLFFNPWFNYTGCVEAKPSTGAGVPANEAQQRLATSGQPANDGGNATGSAAAPAAKVEEDKLASLTPLTPEEANHPDYGQKIYVIDQPTINKHAFVIDAKKDPTLKQLVAAVAAAGTPAEKGECGEDVALHIASTFSGYSNLHQSKIGSNNGFDVVVSAGALPDLCNVRIIEAKQLHQGAIVLSAPNKGPQMGNTWTKNTLKDMKNNSSQAIKDLAKGIEAVGNKVQKLVIAVDAANMRVVIVVLATGY